MDFWHSPLSILSPHKKSNQTLEKLAQAGIQTPWDLIWVLPLRTTPTPKIAPFKEAKGGELFKGQGKILSVQARPSFRGRGKGNARLFNIVTQVQDLYGPSYLSLRWFNTYSSVLKKLQSLNEIDFLGEVSFHHGQLQIVNPKFSSLSLTHETSPSPEILRTYPTVKGISGGKIEALISRISEKAWSELQGTLPKELLLKRDLPSLSDSFLALHALKTCPSRELHKKALTRLAYQEFFEEQVKIQLRRNHVRTQVAKPFVITKEELKKAKALFPYKLTKGQDQALEDIVLQLQIGHPMMRLLQGDVGSGKTTVAAAMAFILLKRGLQSAIMCPTEALALQHERTLRELLKEDSSSLGLLLGSTKKKQKQEIYKKLETNELKIIVGTHSLIQKDVHFHSLALAVIDEQHKFGVKQRLSLLSKGEAVHCLIMTATPIPRSLGLTQYGDLDISTIETLPLGRKGHKTKIVTPDLFSSFLSFIATRLEMGEQVYVVVPAIEESEVMDLHHVQEVTEKFQKYFPKAHLKGLHGKMKSDEKEEILQEMNRGEVQILVSTSVVEVGIDVPNASVMAILNPERFGLSSLHQLRGRVGRGKKMGFCFLVLDESEKKKSRDSLNRLKILEKTTDGFRIAEADLEFRGEGDVFGVMQSGQEKPRKVASLFKHTEELNWAKEDVESLYSKKHPTLLRLMKRLEQDSKIFSTV